jgi:hypothetical protein
MSANALRVAARSAPRRVFTERVRRKVVHEDSRGGRGAHKTGNVLIDHAGKLGLCALLGVVGYFVRNWKGGRAEEDARDELGAQLSISAGEVRELRASNPRFGLVEFDDLTVEAWARYPTGRVTWPDFERLVRTRLSHLGRGVLGSDGGGGEVLAQDHPDEAPLNDTLKDIFASSGGRFPVEGWHVLDRVAHGLPRDHRSQTYALQDLLVVLTHAVDGATTEELIRTVFQLAIMTQNNTQQPHRDGHEPNLLPSSLPGTIASLIHACMIPARNQTIVTNLWPVFEYGRATPDDVLKAAVESMLLLKVEDESRLEVWKSMTFPEGFGTPAPPKFLDFLQGLMSGSADEDGGGGAGGGNTTLSSPGPPTGQVLLVEDFLDLMMSKKLCAFGSCRKKKKKKDAEDEVEDEAVQTSTTDSGLITPAILKRAKALQYRDLMAVKEGDLKQTEVFEPTKTFDFPRSGYYFGWKKDGLSTGLGWHRDYVGIALQEEEQQRQEQRQQHQQQRQISSSNTSTTTSPA